MEKSLNKRQPRKLPKRNKTFSMSEEAEKEFERQFNRLLEKARDKGVKLPKKGDLLSAVILACTKSNVDNYEFK